MLNFLKDREHPDIALPVEIDDKYSPELRPRLEALLKKCFMPDPADRCDARELAVRLRELQVQLQHSESQGGGGDAKVPPMPPNSISLEEHHETVMAAISAIAEQNAEIAMLRNLLPAAPPTSSATTSFVQGDSGAAAADRESRARKKKGMKCTYLRLPVHVGHRIDGYPL
jgi:hypothetical protein